MFYFKTFFKSLKLTFSNKILWFYGGIVSLISIIAVIINGWAGEDGQKFTAILGNLQAKNQSGVAFIIVFTFMALLILVIWISTIAKASLVYYPEKIMKSEKISLKEGWKIGKSKFWKILWLDIFLALTSYLVVSLLINPLEYLYQEKILFAAIPLTIFAIIIFIPLIFLIFFIQVYGYREIVLENKSLAKSITGAYNLYLDNWKTSITMLIIYILSIFYAMFLIITVAFVLVLPLIGLLLVLGAFQIINPASAFALGLAIFSPLTLFLVMFLIIFNQVVWTVVYEKVRKK